VIEIINRIGMIAFGGRIKNYRKEKKLTAIADVYLARYIPCEV
jgi:hypothetical protein